MGEGLGNAEQAPVIKEQFPLILCHSPPPVGLRPPPSPKSGRDSSARFCPDFCASYGMAIQFPAILRLVRGSGGATQPCAASRSARSRSASARLVMIETKMTPTATTAIISVQAALISGETPRRTEE